MMRSNFSGFACVRAFLRVSPRGTEREGERERRAHGQEGREAVSVHEGASREAVILEFFVEQKLGVSR